MTHWPIYSKGTFAVKYCREEKVQLNTVENNVKSWRTKHASGSENKMKLIQS